MSTLKRFLCFLCVSTLMVLGSHQLSLSSELPADRLTVQGHIALQHGDYQQAIALFQQAEALYEEGGNEEGVIGTQVNQAIVLDQAGHKRRACKQLSQTLQIEGVCDPYGLEEIRVEHSIDNEPGLVGLQALSNLLIDIRYLKEAEATIERLTALAPDTPTTLLARLILRNAEIENYLNRQKLSTDTITPDILYQVQRKVSQSDRLLNQLIDAPTPILLPAVIHTLKTEALIHQARITIEQADKANLYDSYLIPEQFQNLGHNRFKALAISIDSLVQLGEPHQHIATLLESAEQFSQTPQEQAKLALLKGQFLDSQNIERQQIVSAYKQAANLATLSHDPILAYTSYHQLATLHTDRPDQKIRFLKQAIDQLEQAKSTLAITPSLLPKLEYDIQSIFHDYMNVLNQQGQPIGPVHSTMKRWRIDTYLRCSNYTASEANEAPSEEGIIHVAVLDEAIVTSIQKNGTERQYFADKEPTLKAIHQLVQELEPRTATRDITAFKVASQQIYDWLLKKAIEENFTTGDTLQFSLDPALDNLPMAALINGERERFLIEDFSITYSTDANQNQYNSDIPTVLIGSMSTQNPNHAFSMRFPPLPEVELEASSIETILHRVYRLNNERFTLNNFKKALEKQQPSIIHIATHGLFSANPRDTVLVAWDRTIHPQTLGQLLGNNPLKLLVLSSCETAEGGKLGISGLALQSGAQSTIASTSIVDSRATYILMSEFYRYLDDGKSVEQSLQIAQQNLLNSSLFKHPAYWSPFIILSN